MVFSLGTNAFASELSVPSKSVNVSSGSHMIPDDELSVYADALGFEMETDDGYILESIIVSYERTEDNELIQPNNFNPDAIGDYVGNVRKASSDVYFPNNPIASNWVDGPLTRIVKRYKQSFTGTFNCTASVKAKVVESGVGFSITEFVDKETEVERPAVASNQRLNIKEFGVFDEYSFTLYSIFGNVKGTGNAYKPMGLYIAQAIYGK